MIIFSIFAPMQHRYFIELAYDGTDYCGWQIQPNGSSVQGVLEDRLSKIMRQPIAVTGAGRTDSGVHASYFVAHINTTDAIKDLQNLVYKLNSFLPADIVVFSIKPVIERAHARFDAIERSYEYHLITQKDPFKRNFACRINYSVNFELMNKAAEVLLRYRDFTSFSKLHTDVKTNNCDVRHAKWVQENDHHWIFQISADRFLRNMVRAIVGTLLEVGAGKTSLSQFEQIIESKNRSLAGTSVPPEGLFLTKIDYPPDLYK